MIRPADGEDAAGPEFGMSGTAVAASTSQTQQPDPPAAGWIGGKLNWLRAGVLGANDGVVSTAALIFGVAGAAAERQTILLAGTAAVVAGAMSMGVGEYVSVSTQRDVERTSIARERAELAADPDAELEELAVMLQSRGLDRDLAVEAAVQMTAKDALAAHARMELGINSEDLANPWSAALASIASFTVGGSVPLGTVILAPHSVALWVAGGAVAAALAATGWISAELGPMPVIPSIARTVLGGFLAMAVTFALGHVAGTQL